MTTGVDIEGGRAPRDSRQPSRRRWIPLGGIVAVTLAVIVSGVVLSSARRVISRALGVELPASAREIQLRPYNWTFGRLVSSGELAAVLKIDRTDVDALFAQLGESEDGRGYDCSLGNFLAYHGLDDVGFSVFRRPDKLVWIDQPDLSGVVAVYRSARREFLVVLHLRRID